MLRIVDKTLHLDYTPGHHLHCLVCQIPNRLGHEGSACRLVNPQQKWAQVRSILELVAAATGNLRKLHFLLFPEVCIPADHLDEMLAYVRTRFRPNTVTIFGVEHVPLRIYLALLRRHAEQSARLTFRQIDACPEDTLNRLLWHSVKGSAAPYPAWAVTLVEEDGDDD